MAYVRKENNLLTFSTEKNITFEVNIKNFHNHDFRISILLVRLLDILVCVNKDTSPKLLHVIQYVFQYMYTTINGLCQECYVLRQECYVTYWTITPLSCEV